MKKGGGGDSGEVHMTSTLLTKMPFYFRYPAFFGSRPSPTEAILNLWEAKNRESSATQGLLSILRGMRRMDCVRLLEQQLQLQQ